MMLKDLLGKTIGFQISGKSKENVIGLKSYFTCFWHTVCYSFFKIVFLLTIVMNMATFQDIRKHHRVPISLMVNCEHSERKFYDYAENISYGGIFIKCADPVDISKTVRLRFSFPGMDEPVKALGEVRWNRKDSPGKENPAGMGVKFLYLDSKGKDYIAQFVRQSSSSPQESQS